MKTIFEQLPLAVRENAFFFFPFIILLLITGVLLVVTETGDAIFFFSQYRSEWSDGLFRYGTRLGEGGLFALATIALLFIKYRYALVLPLLGASVSLVTQSAKAFFAHPRPYAYFRDTNMLGSLIPVEGVHMHSGWNSFPSGHTMAAFALYAFLALCLPRKAWNGFFFLTLAVVVGISRIYLVQHFLKDVFLGAILGVALALFWYLLSFQIWKVPHSRLDNSLMEKFRRKV